jgi:hypothetical protein
MTAPKIKVAEQKQSSHLKENSSLTLEAFMTRHLWNGTKARMMNKTGSRMMEAISFKS